MRAGTARAPSLQNRRLNTSTALRNYRLGDRLLQRHAAARDRFIDALTLFGIGYSWGGFESLVTPADPAKIRTASEPDPRPGIRLSIGLEDAGDLIADLEQALGNWSAP